MLLGTMWKATRAGYDLLLVALCLVILATGPGRYALG